jgi:hypothetical protein
MTTPTLIELADEYAGRSQLTEEAGEAARARLVTALEAQATEIGRLDAGWSSCADALVKTIEECDELRAELAALKAQP